MTPRTDIAVGGLKGSAKLRAVIDTGFDGYLCLPVEVAENLGLELVGRMPTILADGSEKEELVFAGWVEFLEKRQTVVISVTTDEALIGTSLLADCNLAIDFAAGTVNLSRKPSKRRKQ